MQVIHVVKVFQRFQQQFNRVENTVLVWTIVGLALIGFVQVFSRYLFNYSFTWYEELGRYLGVFIAFLGGAIGVRTGSHFTMDLIVSHFHKPWQQLLRCATSLLSASFFFMVAFYSCRIVLRMHGYGTTSPTLEIPMYIAYLPIPFFSIVIGIRFISVAVMFLLSLKKERIQPEDCQQ